MSENQNPTGLGLGLGVGRDEAQFELFAPDRADDGHMNRGVAREIALASVSPGWWRLASALFADRTSEVVVEECREVDGVLQLRASFQGAVPEWLEELLQQLRDAAARTCVCCGSGAAARTRIQLDAPARVTCDSCRRRLRAGETPLSIADQYWRLDGTRRLTPAHGLARITGPAASLISTGRRPCTTLPPAELRAVIRDMHGVMARELIGQDDAAQRLTLLAALHVGGGLPRGARALIVGPSGVGKSTAIHALRGALAEGKWDVPVVMTDAIDLTSPGWSGAPSIGDLIEDALDGEPPDSIRARHALVCIDEIHHIGVAPQHGQHSSSAEKKREVISSLLPLVGYGTLHLGDGTREWSSHNALVICMGAFTDLLDMEKPMTTRALVRAGLHLEFATRFEEIIRLRPLAEPALRNLLAHWPALIGLIETCERLGYTVRIHAETYARAARVVALGYDRSTPRTAGGWLVSALREALIAALADPGIRELIITPDSLAIPINAMRRQPPDEPPDPSGGWDATLVLTPR